MPPLPSHAALHLETSRLLLAPLTEPDADELYPVLNDPALHEYTGDTPLELPALRSRFARWEARRSPDRSELWLNWVIRLRSGTAVGYMQATVTAEDTAEIAYVIGTRWRGQGFATEAARAACAFLRGLGAGPLEAHVHPEHRASQAVARKVGLAPTGESDQEGEDVWREPVPLE